MRIKENEPSKLQGKAQQQCEEAYAQYRVYGKKTRHERWQVTAVTEVLGVPQQATGNLKQHDWRDHHDEFIGHRSLTNDSLIQEPAKSDPTEEPTPRWITVIASLIIILTASELATKDFDEFDESVTEKPSTR